MADERGTPLNQGTNKWLQITTSDDVQTWDGVSKITALKDSLGINDKASLSSANTFQEKQTLNKDAEIHSLTVGRGGGGIGSNTAVGLSSLENNTTGIRNTAVGLSSLENNTTGNENTAVGQISLLNNTTGNDNTAVGRFSLFNNTTGNENTAVGRSSLVNNTTGIRNTAVGVSSLQNNITGDRNTAVGQISLLNNTTGNRNTAVGRFSLFNNTTGNENTAVGRSSLFNNTTGINNIGIGKEAGRSLSPFEVTTQDNRIVIGNNDHTDAYIRISFTVTSDKRDKTNFAEVPYGLDFVKELKPTKFQFREERGSEYTDGKDRYGFLAQDILELEGDEPVIIDNEDPENLKFKEAHLIPVLVNAIQELTKEVETLKEKIND